MKTMKNNKPMWLVWVQNEVGEFTSYNHWANSKEEAINNVKESFFPNKNVIDCTEIKLNTYEIRVVEVQRFEPNDFAGCMKSRALGHDGKYKNKGDK